MLGNKTMRAYLNEAYISNVDEYSLKNNVYEIVLKAIKSNKINVDNGKYDLLTMDHFVVSQQIIHIENTDFYLHYLLNTGVKTNDVSHAIYSYSIDSHTKSKMFIIDKASRHSLFVFNEPFDVSGLVDIIYQKAR
ncbi:MAG: hypothetical protein K5912_03235 [Alphaproteobacteria bacterium]|nr:hypothetical protein [Alphaproteobacteria bacterium]